MRTYIRKVIKNPFLNFGMGIALWFSSSAFTHIFLVRHDAFSNGR